MVSKLGLSETVSEKAAYYYRKVKRVNSRGGRTTIILISACLYAACKFTNSPRTLIDIANVANLTKKHVQRAYTDLCKKLDLQFESFDPINFVGRLASMAGVKEKTKRYATRLLIEANKKGIVTSKNPMGIAGGVLYLSCVLNGEYVSQAKIAQISGISNITIRAMYHLVMEELNITTDHKFLETN
jgi:transcription initiation factor TFIIB